MKYEIPARVIAYLRDEGLRDVPILEDADAAPVLGWGQSRLKQSRVRGDGPRYVKIGKSVRYTPRQILDFTAQNTRGSTSEAVG